MKQYILIFLMIHNIYANAQAFFFDQSSFKQEPKFTLKENFLFDSKGKHIGFLKDGSIYNTNGVQSMWLKAGKIYDLNGYVIAEFDIKPPAYMPVLEIPKNIVPTYQKIEPIYKPYYNKGTTNNFSQNEILETENEFKNKTTSIKPIEYESESINMLEALANHYENQNRISSKRQDLDRNEIEKQKNIFTIFELSKWIDVDLAATASEIYYPKFIEYLDKNKSTDPLLTKLYAYELVSEIQDWNNKINNFKAIIKDEIENLASDNKNLNINALKLKQESYNIGLYNTTYNSNGIRVIKYKKADQLNTSTVNYPELIWNSHAEDFISPPDYKYIQKIKNATLLHHGLSLYVYQVKYLNKKNLVISKLDTIITYGNIRIANDSVRLPIYTLDSNKLFRPSTYDSIMNFIQVTNPDVIIAYKYFLKNELVKRGKAQLVYNQEYVGNKIDGFKVAYTTIKDKNLFIQESIYFLTKLFCDTKYIQFNELEPYKSKKLINQITIPFPDNFFSNQLDRNIK